MGYRPSREARASRAAVWPQPGRCTVRPMNRRLAAAVVVSVFASACQGTSGASPSAMDETTARPSATAPTEATPSTTQSARPEATAQPSASPEAAIRPDAVVATIVEDLSVRRSPGTEGERMGFLELGTIAFVLEGPADNNGVPWYRITGMGLPYASGCATTPPDQPISCPAFVGWVAGASDAGNPWLAPTDPGACPEPTVRGISEAGFTWRLVCWSDEPITFDAWWPEIPDDAGLGGFCPQADEPAAWLYCEQTNFNGVNASPEEGFVNRLHLSIDPDSGVTMPPRGQWVRATGQFDHPAAAQCADMAADGEEPHDAELRCRLQFVPTSVEPLGG